MPGTNMHAHLFEVRTRTPEAIMGFHTRENVCSVSSRLEFKQGGQL